MAKTLVAINKATDTFDTWVDRTNELVSAFGETLTANTNANGAYVTGNSFLFGIFGANTITVHTGLRGGNVQTSAPLFISSNLIINTAAADYARVGNDSVYVLANSTTFYTVNGSITASLKHTGLTVGNVFANQSHLYVGSGAVNVIANTSTLVLGGNVGANQTHLYIGNATVNAVINSSSVSMGAGGVFANQTHFRVGATAANVMVNTTAVAVGANAYLNATELFIGNATANAFANSILLKVANATGIANISPFGLTTGTSVVNTTTIAAGANVLLSTSALSIGNSTANALANSILVKVANSTGIANLSPFGLITGTSTVNTTVIAAGANVYANVTHMFVGNATVNVVTNSSTIFLGGNVGANQTHLYIGNATVNVVANSSSFSLGGNVFANQTHIRIGAGSTNVTINSSAISIGGVTSLTSDLRDSVALTTSPGGSATLIGTRARINFVQGNNVLLNISDDSGGGQVNVMINAVATSGGAIIGGTDQAVQYNDNMNFGGDIAKLKFDKASSILTCANTIVACGQVVYTYSIQQKGVEFSAVTSSGPDDVDNFAIATYRSCDYFYSIKNTGVGANAYQSGRLIVLQDGGSVSLEEYGVAISNTNFGHLGVFSAALAPNTTHILLQFTPLSSLTYTARLFRTSIPV